MGLTDRLTVLSSKSKSDAFFLIFIFFALNKCFQRPFYCRTFEPKLRGPLSVTISTGPLCRIPCTHVHYLSLSKKKKKNTLEHRRNQPLFINKNDSISLYFSIISNSNIVRKGESCPLTDRPGSNLC